MAHMERTSIYLTKEQQKRLTNRASEMDVSRSELIHRLLDEGLGITRRQDRLEQALEASRGIWSDRTDNEVLPWRREAPLVRLDR